MQNAGKATDTQRGNRPTDGQYYKSAYYYFYESFERMEKMPEGFRKGSTATLNNLEKLLAIFIETAKEIEKARQATVILRLYERAGTNQ